MQRFQRINLDGETMSARNRRALRSCRQQIVKELDAQQFLAALASEAKLKGDTREQILNFPTKEQRAGALLDWVLSRGDKTFWLFADCLREKWRPLYLELENLLKKEIEEEEIKENEKTMSGDGVRKLIAKRVNDRSLSAQISAPDSDEGEGRLERGECDYVECYVIPMRGRLQSESWLRRKYEPKIIGSVNESGEFADKISDQYMAELSESKVFKKINLLLLPECVKKPPIESDVYIIDLDKTLDDAVDEEKRNACQSFASQLPPTSDAIASSKIQTSVVEEETVKEAPSQPPPLPPKPDSLPALSFGTASKTKTSMAHKDQSAVDGQVVDGTEIDEDIPVKPPERTTSKQKISPLKPKPLPKPEGLCAKLQPSSTNELTETVVISEQPLSPAMPLETSVAAGFSASIESKLKESHESNFNNDITTEEKLENDTEQDAEVGSSKRDEFCAATGNSVHSQMYDKIELEEEMSFNGDQPLYGVEGESCNTNREDSNALKSSSADNLISKSMRGDVRDKSKWSSFDSGLAGESVSLSSPLKNFSESQPAVAGHFGREPLLSDHVRRESISSDGDSFYEDIDVLGDRNIPLNDSQQDSQQFYLLPQAMGRQQPAHAPPVVRLTSLDDLTPSTVVLNKGDLLLAERKSAWLSAAAVSEANDSASKLGFSVNLSGTVLATDKVGRFFYVPISFLKCYGDPSAEPWFYPMPITSRQAAIFLSEVKIEGCFVVYKPSYASNLAIAYNLSLCIHTGDIVHYHILEDIHGNLLIEGDDHSFVTIKHLVQYYQRNKGRLATRLRRPMKEAHLAIVPGHHYDAKWEIDRAALKLSSHMIGQGSFGYLCSGVYGRTPVSVKVLQRGDITPSVEDDFVEEAKCLMSLNHEHVINFVGISCKFRPFYIVCELVSRGTLRDSLRTMSRTVDTLFDFCLQITSAMSYLEEQRYVIHRDLTAQHFLLGEDGVVKLTEFSRARRVEDDSYQASRTERLSIKWSAPEVLMHSTYSTKSDVWAIGVVFWEIFSYGERPYSALTSDQSAMYVVEGGRLDRPKGCPQDMYALMKSCWQESPDERPSFAQIQNNLKSKSSIYYFGPIKYRPPATKTASLDLAEPPVLATSKGPAARRTVAESVPNYEGNAPVTRRVVAESVSNYEINSQTSVSSQRLSSDNYYGSEFLAPATSETSLATVTNEGDLSRGGKIRKSLRNLMKVSHKKSAKSPSSKGGLTLHSNGKQAAI